MIKLEPASCDDKSLLKKIIDKKHGRNQKRCENCGKEQTPECDNCDNYDNRALMEAVMPYVFERYDFYAMNTTKLNEIKKEVRITKYTQNLFLKAYEKSVDFQKARKKISRIYPLQFERNVHFA